MRSIFLNLLFIFFGATSLFSQDWSTIKTFSPSQTLKDVLFVNSSTAYAVSALYNGSALNVKKTTDAGVNWVAQYTGQTSNSFKEIATPNEGDDVYIIGNSGIMIHTNDAGENWNTQDQSQSNSVLHPITSKGKACI